MKIKGKNATIKVGDKVAGIAKDVTIETIEKCPHCGCNLDKKGECDYCFQQWVNKMCN
jgi:hypothetical protein